MKVWRLSDINSLLKNVFHAVMKGEFLLRLNVGKYFIHIIYTFFLFGMVIWTSLAIETTMAKVERNKAVLKELEIANAQKYYDLAKASGRYDVEQRLKSMGSEVGEARKPATEMAR